MSGGQDLRIGTFLLRGGRSKGGKGKGGKGKKGKKESYDLIVNIDLDEWKLTDEQVRIMQSWSIIGWGILLNNIYPVIYTGWTMLEIIC